MWSGLVKGGPRTISRPETVSLECHLHTHSINTPILKAILYIPSLPPPHHLSLSPSLICMYQCVCKLVCTALHLERGP